jgi:hypothetical protein
MFSNIETAIMMKMRYHHVKIGFVKELVSEINRKCVELLKTPSSHFLAFLSHVKKEAGPTATLLQVLLHSQLREKGKMDEIFLDCDHLSDLRRLPDQMGNHEYL